MPLYYFGFNGFGQISNLCDEYRTNKLKLSDNDWPKLSMSWDTLCQISAENRLVFHGIFDASNTDSVKMVSVIDAAICDKFLVVVTDSGFGKIYEHTSQGYNETKKVELHKQKLSKCFVGDSDALFINEVGKVVWVSLKPKMEEYLLPLAWKVVEVSCGKEHVVLLNENGTVYTFGQGSRGQLGNGTIESEANPNVVECLEGIPVKHIAAGGWHSAAVTNNGDLYTWGWNESGQLGFPTTRKPKTDDNNVQQDSQAVSVQTVPIPVHFDDGISIENVSCGSRHTLAVADGRLWAFGWNQYNQLGMKDKPGFVSKPTLVKEFLQENESVLDVRCDGWSSMVLTCIKPCK